MSGNRSRQKTTCRQTTFQLLEEFYSFEIPDYIINVGKTFIEIRISQWEGDKVHNLKITIDDVVQYYLTQAPNIYSGMREIAGYSGDWRHIDNVAKECLSWFKYVNPEKLRRASRKVGLEPKF